MKLIWRKSGDAERLAIEQAPQAQPASPLETAVSPQPAAEPAAAPAPQPTREELLEQQMRKIKRSYARAPGRRFDARGYASALAAVLDQFGELARASRMRQYAASRHQADKRTSAPSMLRAAYQERINTRSAVLHSVLSGAIRIDASIKELARARDDELAALEHRVGLHQYSDDSPEKAHLMWSSGEVRGEVRTYDRGYLHTGSMTFPKERAPLLVVTPETMAEQRKAVIARYDPRILELCEQRAKAEEAVMEARKAHNALMGKLAAIERGRAPQLTRDEYRTISSDYRAYMHGTLHKRR